RPAHHGRRLPSEGRLGPRRLGEVAPPGEPWAPGGAMAPGGGRMSLHEQAAQLRRAIEIGIPLRSSQEPAAEWRRAKQSMAWMRSQLARIEAQIENEGPDEWAMML